MTRSFDQTVRQVGDSARRSSARRWAAAMTTSRQVGLCMIMAVLTAQACTYGSALPGPAPLAEDTTGLYVVVFNQSSKPTKLELLLDGIVILDTVANVAPVSPAITVRRRYQPAPGMHTVEVRDVTRQRRETVEISVGEGRQANLHVSVGERSWVHVVYGIQVYL